MPSVILKSPNLVSLGKVMVAPEISMFLSMGISLIAQRIKGHE